MSCKECFSDYLFNCQDTIMINALLEPARLYTVVITDKFNKEYSHEYLSNGDGFIELQVDDFPDGFFNQFAGDFKLEILTDECTKVRFKIAKDYDCIEFSVTGGTRQKNNLGCDFDCVGNPCENSAIFPFTDVSTVSIAWTDLLRTLYGNTPTVDVYILTAPNTYEQVTGDVVITLTGGPYDLTSVDVNLGGNATGYILIHS